MATNDAVDHDLDTQLLTRFLQRHFHNSKPTDIVSVCVKDAVAKGENYSSHVYRVKLSCLLASGRKRTYSMIVKTELRSAAAKESLAALPVFRTEVKMFTSLLPLMEDLQEEFGDKRECLWANFYGYIPYKLVAIEDLSDQNFVSADRKKCLDLNHALLVLRGLGRFHAMSKVLLARQLITEEDKGKLAVVGHSEFVKQMWHAVFTVLTDCMIASWGSEWLDLSKRIAAREKNIVGTMTDLSEAYDKRFEVLNHGDSWTTNFLFKYLEFETFPVSVKFIDFQGCHLNSFIWDIEYFINTSVEPKVRRQQKDKLLHSYQESLEKNLKLLNYSGYIPTLEDVKSESQRLVYASLALMFVSPLMFADTNRAFALDKLMSHPPSEVIESSVFTDGKALAALGEDMKKYASAGLI